MTSAGNDHEIIKSSDLIEPEMVQSVETKGDIIKIVAAASIVATALLIGVVFLGIAIRLEDSELRSWATGLVSLIVGAAIGFVFNGHSSGGNNSGS